MSASDWSGLMTLTAMRLENKQVSLFLPCIYIYISFRCYVHLDVVVSRLLRDFTQLLCCYLIGASQGTKGGRSTEQRGIDAAMNEEMSIKLVRV
jgi:hypothetical protein